MPTKQVVQNKTISIVNARFFFYNLRNFF